MSNEWWMAGVVGALALLWIGRRLDSRKGWVCIVVAMAATAAGMWQWEKSLARRERSMGSLRATTPREGRPGGYVSSDTCRSCHPSQHASWHHSFHRTMTQYASPESVRGNFQNISLSYAGKRYEFRERAGEFYCEMVDPDWEYVEILKRRSRDSPAPIAPAEYATAPRVEKRVGLVTGSHSMQAYWVSSRFGNMQFSLPFTHVLELSRWVPRNDVFLLDPQRPWIPDVWNVNCIQCHATAGQPRQDPKTAVIDSRAAELGISCEACHGPAEEHVRVNADPRRRYDFHADGKSDPTIFNPARADHIKSSETCGQCHAIRTRARPAEWQQDGFPFKPGEAIESCAPLHRFQETELRGPAGDAQRHLAEGSYWPDGMIRISGRDFSAMSTSACYKRGELSCLSCHSMHQYEDHDDQLSREGEGNAACVQCHTAYESQLEQHTHHKSGSSGSLCYNCHMPHTAYGLMKAIRSHQIDSPSIQSSIATGRPNACNLCHLDRSLGWAATALHTWYGRAVPALAADEHEISAAAKWILSGDAGQRAVVAWHFGWGPAAAASGRDWLAPYLAELLRDPYAVVRHVASRSLRRLKGFEDFPYDYIGPEVERGRASERALEIWNASARSQRPGGAAVLMDPSGSLDRERFSALVRRRNNRPLELLE